MSGRLRSKAPKSQGRGTSLEEPVQLLSGTVPAALAEALMSLFGKKESRGRGFRL